MNSEYLLYGAAVGLGVIGWFIRRDISRFEKTVSTLHDSINDIKEQVRGVSEIVKLQPDMIRFFGTNGGQQRIWEEIGKFKTDIERLRERDHWVANKLSIIKGKLEHPKAKLSKEDWELPKFGEDE